MQSLDVGIFQHYKHWHDVALQEFVSKSFIEYSLGQFLNDLTKIRDNTFKPTIIRHAFQRSGMWPISSKVCIKLLKTFKPTSIDIGIDEPSLPTRQNHPRKIADVNYDLIHR